MPDDYAVGASRLHFLELVGRGRILVTGMHPGHEHDHKLKPNNLKYVCHMRKRQSPFAFRAKEEVRREGSPTATRVSQAF